MSASRIIGFTQRAKRDIRTNPTRIRIVTDLKNHETEVEQEVCVCSEFSFKVKMLRSKFKKSDWKASLEGLIREKLSSLGFTVNDLDLECVCACT